MNKRDYARLLRLKHQEGERLLNNPKSDPYMRAYAFGLCDSANDLLISIGFSPEESKFEQEIREQRAAEISKIMKKML